MALEYNGEYHLKPQTARKDKYKIKECKKRGIKLIVIKEYEFKQRRDFIKEIPPQVLKECKRLNIKIKNPKELPRLIFNKVEFTLYDIKLTIKKYKDIKSFIRDHIKMYRFLVANKQLALTKHLKRRFIKKFPNSTYNKEQVITLAKKFKTLKSFREAYKSAYGHALKHKYAHELNLTKLPGAPYWTKDLIMEEAKKYNLYNEFKRKSNGAYSRAGKLGILEEIKSLFK